jgi:small subunit ribosomal protein S20
VYIEFIKEELMPIIKSAKKRVKVAKRATSQNLKTKRNLKSAMKSVRLASSGSKKSLSDAQRKAQSALDKAGKKGIMHKHKVARKQRQLAARAKAAGATTTSTAKKAAPKKTTSAKAKK